VPGTDLVSANRGLMRVALVITPSRATLGRCRHPGGVVPTGALTSRWSGPAWTAAVKTSVAGPAAQRRAVRWDDDSAPASTVDFRDSADLVPSALHAWWGRRSTQRRDETQSMESLAGSHSRVLDRQSIARCRRRQVVPRTSCAIPAVSRRVLSSRRHDRAWGTIPEGAVARTVHLGILIVTWLATLTLLLSPTARAVGSLTSGSSGPTWLRAWTSNRWAPAAQPLTVRWQWRRSSAHRCGVGLRDVAHC